MLSTRIYGDDKRHGYRGLYPLRAANLIHPDRVEARKGSNSRFRNLLLSLIGICRPTILSIGVQI
jgi:hypothetical protein